MNSFRSLTTAFLASAFIYAAGPANAAPVLYEFSLNNAIGDPVYTGLLSIDDSRLMPSTFTAFDDSNFFSLSITTGLRTYTLANADEPSIDGVMTDATGEIVVFLDSTSDLTVMFVSLGSPNIFLTIDELIPTQWMEFSLSPFTTYGSGPSVSFSRVPKPATLALFALFGLGLAGLGVARRRKAASSISIAPK